MEVISKTRKFLSDLVIYTKYASYLPVEKRRQTWEECVNVLKEMHTYKYPALAKEIDEVFKYVYGRKVLPSMRSMQYGGLPIELNPSRIYNCAYALIDHEFAFSELAFLLMSGCGVGYSVRSRHVKKLPQVKSPDGERRFMIGDSIEGWADSFRQLMYAYLRGKTRPVFDYRDIRRKGSLIKKTGGRAPGHAKLKQCHINVEAVLKRAVGRRLTTLEVHDICCYMAECIVAGGVRTSAMISLFDIEDRSMTTCKGMFKCKDMSLFSESEHEYVVKFKLADQEMNTNVYGRTDKDGYITIKISKQFGEDDYKNLMLKSELAWYYIHPQRAMSNNSVVLRRGEIKEKQFFDLWKKMSKEKSGEPGILWVNDEDEGCNPCGEISFTNGNGFCNLTTAVVYDVETQEEFNNRVKAAAFLGTLQAGYTDFHYLRGMWKENTERDAMLGVSLTGIASGKILDMNIKEAAGIAVLENERVAKLIGINKATKITTLKPEGSGTLAAGYIGNGIHPIWAGHFVRNNRIKKHDPVYKFLVDIIPDFVEDEFNNEQDGAVISIPIEAPDGAITRGESSIDMLKRIKKFSDEWIKSGHRKGVSTHNVSATVYIKNDEWESVGRWMWDNRNSYNGLSVLPFMDSDHNYKQAPFIELTKGEYDEMFAKFPESVDFTKIIEEDDNTTLSAEGACVSGACSL